MNSLEFDKWVESYENDVYKKKDIYPFDGYFRNVEYLKSIITNIDGCHLLDIGIGTGLMHSLMLVENEYELDGLDFSANMCAFVSRRFPSSSIFKWDLTSNQIPLDISKVKYDLIVSAYCLHHFNHSFKKDIIDLYFNLLLPGGKFVLIDIAFDDIKSKQIQAKIAGKSWDKEEADGYMIKNEIIQLLSQKYNVEYTKVSNCAAFCLISKY